jgi:hypothetical protein
MREIIFVGDGRDFHARDWYLTIKKICSSRAVIYVTDLIESEGCPRLVNENDIIINLFNIDRLLFKKVSKWGNYWRNIIKVLAFPIQVPRLKKIVKDYPNAVFHAHTMYYMFLCWMAQIEYIGTPQGSEILVRPYRSMIYRFFARKALLAANHIVVDSVNLQNGILKLCGKTSNVIQNGINADEIEQNIKGIKKNRTHIASIRGLYQNYRIEEIFAARDRCTFFTPLLLFYPFSEYGYKKNLSKKMTEKDVDLGRIETKEEMYRVLGATLLAISIPESDSSPRSVYESLFCGCCVAVSYNPWIEMLPECMRVRVVVVNIEEDLWLEKAIEQARIITRESFIPSKEALELYDQTRSMKIVADLFY